MPRQQLRSRGRPSKTESLAFRLIALASYCSHLSQEAIAARVNAALSPDSVTQPTVGKWIRTELPRYVRPTIALKRPDEVGLHVACFLFRRKPARAIALARALAREPSVSRIERWRGEVTVFAEVVALNDQTIDELIERYEPDAVYPLVERRDRIALVLRHLGRSAPR